MHVHILRISPYTLYIYDRHHHSNGYAYATLDTKMNLHVYWSVPRDFDTYEFIYIACGSNRYIFRTVNAIDFLFSYHTISLCELYFCALHKHSADVMRSNIQWGSILPHLQVGAFKLLQIRHVRRSIDLFCSLIFTFSVTEIPLCKVNAHFPGRFAPLPIQ